MALGNCRFSTTKSSVGPQHHLLRTQLQPDALRKGAAAEGDATGDEATPLANAEEQQAAAPAAPAETPNQCGGAFRGRRRKPIDAIHGTNTQSPDAQLHGGATADGR